MDSMVAKLCKGSCITELLLSAATSAREGGSRAPMPKTFPLPASPSSFASRSIPSRPSQLRQTNARGLLQLLQEHDPCSKADLVRYSGLSAPTVSSAIAHLESLGLVEQIGDGE